MRRCGLEIKASPQQVVRTLPQDFARLFPGSGGALYGQATHGWMSAFARPSSRSKVPGLYTAGGSVHPGPGVPMAAMSGRLAAATLMAMPSVEEGFGLVFIEAMRRGVPVIASRVDAGQEVNLDGVTGFNIDRERPEALTEAIVGLLRDRDASARMGAAGFARWRDVYRFSAFDRRLQQAMRPFLES